MGSNQPVKMKNYNDSKKTTQKSKYAAYLDGNKKLASNTVNSPTLLYPPASTKIKMKAISTKINSQAMQLKWAWNSKETLKEAAEIINIENC